MSSCPMHDGAGVSEPQSVQGRPPHTKLSQSMVIFALGVVLLWMWISSCAVAQDVDSLLGQRVMVVGKDVRFRLQDESPGPAPLGMVLEVSNVNGPWRWFKGQRGWINKKDVVRLDQAIEHLTAAIDESPTSEAYRERGVEGRFWNSHLLFKCHRLTTLFRDRVSPLLEALLSMA